MSAACAPVNPSWHLTIKADARWRCHRGGNRRALPSRQFVTQYSGEPTGRSGHEVEVQRRIYELHPRDFPPPVWGYLIGRIRVVAKQATPQGGRNLADCSPGPHIQWSAVAGQADGRGECKLIAREAT
jgi:hypothetical protein